MYLLFVLIFPATIADLLQLAMPMFQPQCIAHTPLPPPLPSIDTAPMYKFHNR